MQSANLAIDWPSSMLIDDQGESNQGFKNKWNYRANVISMWSLWMHCQVPSCATQGLDHPVGESPRWHNQQHKFSCTSTDEMKYIKVLEKDSRFIWYNLRLVFTRRWVDQPITRAVPAQMHFK